MKAKTDFFHQADDISQPLTIGIKYHSAKVSRLLQTFIKRVHGNNQGPDIGFSVTFRRVFIMGEQAGRGQSA